MPRSAKAILHRQVSRLALVAALAMLSSVPVLRAEAQQTDDGNQDKHLDIRSSAGDLHVGNDADVRDIGLPLYPGARLKHHEHDKNSANLAIFTAAFGMKLVVVNYDSDDSPSKLIAY